jgi:hypothetical protein
MGLWGWLRGRTGGTQDGRVAQWQRDWAAAVESPDRAQLEALAARLDALGLSDDDVEIEREMLDGLEQLVELDGSVAAEGLPRLETGHRVVGADTCHFSAPVSMPDDPAQPCGRLILTSSRAIFVGGARGTTFPWHTIGEVVQRDRDVILVRHDRETLSRFRCNSFGDAVCGAFLARYLSNRRKGRSTRSAV